MNLLAKYTPVDAGGLDADKDVAQEFFREHFNEIFTAFSNQKQMLEEARILLKEAEFRRALPKLNLIAPSEGILWGARNRKPRLKTALAEMHRMREVADDLITTCEDYSDMLDAIAKGDNVKYAAIAKAASRRGVFNYVETLFKGLFMTRSWIYPGVTVWGRRNSGSRAINAIAKFTGSGGFNILFANIPYGTNDDQMYEEAEFKELKKACEVMVKSCDDLEKALNGFVGRYGKAKSEVATVKVADFRMDIENMEAAFKGLCSTAQYCTKQLSRFWK